MIVWHTQRPRPRLRFPWTWIGDFGLGLGPGTWNLQLGLVRARGSPFCPYTILPQDTVNLNYENHGERSTRPQ